MSLPQKPDNVLPFQKPPRKGSALDWRLGTDNRCRERFEIFAATITPPYLTDDQLLIDCLFACLSADAEKLAQVKWLLSQSGVTI